MRNGWKTKTLEEVCQFTNGLWKGEKPPFVRVGVIRNTNFTKEGLLNDSDIAYLDVEAKKFATRRLQFGDLILEKSGGGPKQAVGRVALFDKSDGDFSFSNFTSALRVLDPDELDFRYLHKFLCWTYGSGLTERMQSHSTGIRNLNANAYKGIQIGLPPLPEQQRIVRLLDEAFKGIATAKANAEKNLQNASALFDSQLQSVFAHRGATWMQESLESLVSSGAVQLTRGKVISKKDLAATPGEYPVYSSARENNGQFGAYGHFMFDEELITWSVDGGGRLFHRQRHKFSVTNVGGILRILRPDQLSYAYLYRVLSYLHAQVRFDWVRKAHPSVILKLYDDIPVPPLAIQTRLAVSLEEVERETKQLEAIYERKLVALEELKTSLLHQAFTGQLGAPTA